MKRIAICLSGVPRKHFNIKFVKKLKEKYKLHIFMHCWQPENDLLFHKNNKIMNPSENFFNVYKENYACGYQIFDPNFYKIEGVELIFKKENFYDNKNQFEKIYSDIDPNKLGFRQDLGVVSMFYSIKASNQLREQYEEEKNIVFDCVIRSRFEVEFKDDNFNFDLNDYDLNKIYLPDYNLAPINDHFAFSSSYNMSIYSSTFDNLVDLINNGQATYCYPESVLQQNILEIKTQQISFVQTCI